MKVTVVGTSGLISYKDKKTGEEKRARNIYIVREPTSRETGGTGLISAAIFLPESLFSKIPVGGFDPKKKYDFIYESDGRFSFLSDIQEAS